MNIKLLKVGLLCAALGLASCGSSSDSGTTTASITTVTSNTGTVTVKTTPNDVVSIGATGTVFKTADASGQAVFSGLTPGAIDVHIFSVDGYSATSYYGIDSSIIDNVGVITTGPSVIDVYVSVVNGDAVGQTLYLNTTNNRYPGFRNTVTGLTTFFVNDKPAGTILSGTIYVGQGVATSSAGNNVQGNAEMLNLGTHSLTTTAISGAAQINITANFAAVAPTPPLLVTLSAVTPPIGLNLVSARFADATIANAPLVFPDTIAVAAVVDNTWDMFALDVTGTKNWVKGGVFTVGGTLSVVATLNTPTLTGNQTGATISWTDSGVGFVSYKNISIEDAGFVNTWYIAAPSNVSSITLPTVPASATSPLTAGATYRLTVGNVNWDNLTYQQLFQLTGEPVPTLFELSDVYTAYTR